MQKEGVLRDREEVAEKHVLEQVADDHRVSGPLLMTYSWTLLAPHGPLGTPQIQQMQAGKRDGVARDAKEASL